MAETIREELQIPNYNFTFYTDSQVVLGYISKDAKRFHVYVSNRVSRIRSFCGPGRWRYIMSEQNPADVASRGCSTRELPQSTWLSRPDFLRDDTQLGDQPQTYDLVNPDMDEEVRKQVTCMRKPVLHLRDLNRHSRETCLHDVSGLRNFNMDEFSPCHCVPQTICG